MNQTDTSDHGVIVLTAFYSVYVNVSFKSVEGTRDLNSQLSLAVTVCELSIVLYSEQTVKCTSIICTNIFILYLSGISYECNFLPHQIMFHLEIAFI